MTRESTAFSRFCDGDRQVGQEEFNVVMAAMREGKVPACGYWVYQLTRALAAKNGKNVDLLQPYELIHSDPGKEGPLESEAARFVEENF